MTKRITFPDSLILLGGLIGATPVSWWFGFLGVFMAAHVAILIGYLAEPSRRRMRLAAAMVVLVWWPFWLGHWFWD